jgi:hypothetical protein
MRLVRGGLICEYLEAVAKLSAVALGIIFVQFKARGAWLTRVNERRTTQRCTIMVPALRVGPEISASGVAALG